MKTTITSVIYFIVGALFLIFQNHQPFITAFVLKALIMIVLMVLYLQNIHLAGNRSHIILLAGLIFSWIGDIFLEVPGEYGNMFIPGLVSFLMAHVMYIIVFFLTPGKSVFSGKRVLLILPLLLYGFILVFLLYDNLGPMRLPVIIYAIVILVMLAGAINRFEKAGRVSYRLIVAGAILFVLSDSAIAINKFGYGFKGAEWFIMINYIFAQYLIVSGYIWQVKRD